MNVTIIRSHTDKIEKVKRGTDEVVIVEVFIRSLFDMKFKGENVHCKYSLK